MDTSRRGAYECVPECREDTIEARGAASYGLLVRLLRRGLLDNGYVELPITSLHAVAIDGLPPLHKDPFDRLLLAQTPARASHSSPVTRDLPDTPGPYARCRRPRDHPPHSWIRR